MGHRLRIALGVLLMGGLAVGIGVWWSQGPSESEVRRTVLTTVQDEAPASFLVTGTLDIHATVHVDSSQFLTPDWVTFVLERTQPTVLSLLQGASQSRVRVPGRVSYGFDVRSLRSEMIGVEENGVVTVDLPELSVHSVEPDLSRLQIRTTTKGWMRVFPSDAPADVRKRALSDVREAFETQAERRIESATQPQVNTARALEKMLTPPLQAAGIANPRFRIRIGDRLALQPEGEE
jgi:hypothetical protein